MLSRNLTIARYDAEIFDEMDKEAQRQEEQIELIASENYTSPAVMEAQGSVLTNKYAEGYQESVTTVVVSTLILLSNWQLIALKNCSAPITPTCSPMQVHRPTPLCT